MNAMRNKEWSYEWVISSPSWSYIEHLIVTAYYRQNFSPYVHDGIKCQIQKYLKGAFIDLTNVGGLKYGGIFNIHDIKQIRNKKLVKNQRDRHFTFTSPVFVIKSWRLQLELKALFKSSNNWLFVVRLRSLNERKENEESTYFTRCYFRVAIKEFTKVVPPEKCSVCFSNGDSRACKFDQLPSKTVDCLKELTIQFCEYDDDTEVVSKSIALPSYKNVWRIPLHKLECETRQFWSERFAFCPDDASTAQAVHFFFSIDRKDASTAAIYLNLSLFPKNMEKITVRTKVFMMGFVEYNDDENVRKRETFTPNVNKVKVAECSLPPYARSIVLFLEVTVLEQFASKSEPFPLIFKPSKPKIFTSKYMWNVTDIDRNTPNMFGITSNIFMAKLFKWYITLYPNGIDKKTEGKFCVTLTMANFQIGAKMEALCGVDIMEIDFRWKQVINCTTGTVIVTDATLSDILWQRASLSIEISFGLFTVNDVVNDVHHECNDIVIKPEQCIWNINKKWLTRTPLSERKSCIGLQSKIFEMYSMRWYLSIYPKSSLNKNTPSVKLTLVSFPSNVTVLYTRCIFTTNEPEMKYIVNGVFDKDGDQNSVEWGNDILSVDQLDACTMRLDMELIDVYNDCLNITSDFIPDNEDNHDDEDMEEMKFNEDHISDAEKTELETWFHKKVQLPQYYSVFVRNGIDRLDIAKLITVDELKEMKITVIGHRVKILHGIRELNVIRIPVSEPELDTFGCPLYVCSCPH